MIIYPRWLEDCPSFNITLWRLQTLGSCPVLFHATAPLVYLMFSVFAHSKKENNEGNAWLNVVLSEFSPKSYSFLL